MFLAEGRKSRCFLSGEIEIGPEKERWALAGVEAAAAAARLGPVAR